MKIKNYSLKVKKGSVHVCLYIVLAVRKPKIESKLLARSIDKIISTKPNINSRKCIETSRKDVMQQSDLNQKT